MNKIPFKKLGKNKWMNNARHGYMHNTYMKGSYQGEGSTQKKRIPQFGLQHYKK